jgi:hypothetical protein
MIAEPLGVADGHDAGCLPGHPRCLVPLTATRI